MDWSEYKTQDAVSLAALVSNGDISKTEAVETAIAAAERFNPHINAIVTPLYDEGLETTPEAGPLAGVPFLIKDITMLKGVRCSYGSRLWQDFKPDHDAEIVNRFRAAGLAIIGKSNTPEMGLAATTESDYLGACHNPFDLALTPGGSSGGAAAAVAAGILPVAHATDGGGSIRIPASCCGLVGLKPTRARTPLGPDVGEGWGSMSTGLVVSRTVRDTALLLDVTHGPAAGDPYSAPYFGGNYMSDHCTPSRQLTIGIDLHPASHGEVSQECKSGTYQTAELLADMGHNIIELEKDYDAQVLSAATFTLTSSNVSHSVRARAATLGIMDDRLSDYIESNTAFAVKNGINVTGADYAAAMMTIHGMGRTVAKRFQSVDYILSPTLLTPPVPLGYMNTNDGNHHLYVEHIHAFWGFTHLYNATGNPAISLPLHWTNDGLPVGIQLIGPMGDELGLLQLARELEEAKPWVDRYASIEL